jgi:hypothetical protein
MILIIETRRGTKLPPHLTEEIKEIFMINGVGAHYKMFLDNIELLPLAANLLNSSAKKFDEKYYDYKHELLKYIITEHRYFWVDIEEGVLFFETPYGQVSFHTTQSVLDMALEEGVSPLHKEWDGENTQLIALDLIW